MKKCPFCAEEILDEATKCRFCGEMLVRRRGFLGIVASTVTLIASIAYAVYIWFGQHMEHGHGRIMFTDPEHVLSLVFVVGSALWTWRAIARRRRR